MPFTDEEKNELKALYKDSFLDALKQYDSERAEWEANVNAQNQNGNGNGNDGNDNKPAPSLAERLMGGSRSSKSK